MRIGELLVEQRKLRQSDLDRAIAAQPPGQRLASFLIACGLVEFDDASRALGELKGITCALLRHLDGRDATVASAIPAALGRSLCALPIGRTSRGAMIVCVRDPAPSVLAALRTAISTDVMMVIAPATRLEKLVDIVYGAAPVEEVDVDFSAPVEIPLDAGELEASDLEPLDEDPLADDLSALDADSVRMALTDLDDERVSKDPTQSGQHTVPPLSSPSILLRTTRPMSLGATSVGLEHATSREAATDLALAFVASRWHSGLVLAIRDKAAVGYRGHGVTMPELVSVPLHLPSTLARAVESRSVSFDTPTGPAQDALRRALGGSVAIAAPVIVNGQPVAAIVVGDPIDKTVGASASAGELATLADALGKAYQRIVVR